MTPLLTPEQVAEILGISPRTVNELCNRKKLGYVQVDSKHRRFTEEMVQEFIDRQAVSSEGQRPSRSEKPKSPITSKAPAKGGTPTLDSIKKEMETWE
jgi:excisionase family DNA binding protein